MLNYNYLFTYRDFLQRGLNDGRMWTNLHKRASDGKSMHCKVIK